MSLKHALLGLLSFGPMTGYELKKLMDASTAFFWHAELAQIYPTLKQLDEAGLIESEVAPQEGRPDKKIYAITQAGQEAFVEWLRQPLDTLPPGKDPVLLQLFFSGVLDKATLLEQLRRQLRLHRAQLARYETETRAYIQDVVAQSGMQREGVLWELVRQFGEAYEQQYVRWLEHAIATVEEQL